jgi:Ca-activated chloride channel family protein
MRFAAPSWLWLLVPLAGLVAAYLWAQRRRSRYAVRFATLPMLASLTPRGPGWRRHAPAAAFLVALVVLTLAIAQPSVDVRVPREQATVVVALDVSPSMQATDIAPDRASVSRQAAIEFIEALPDSFHVGVVAFSGTAIPVAPPSTDHDAAIRAVRALEIGESTAIGEAVFTALEGIEAVNTQTPGAPPPARIVLLSDGSSTTGRSPEEAAAAARRAGVPVSTIAYGTENGQVLIGGRSVPVPVDVDALRELAEDTGGTFSTARDDQELRGVYQELESTLGWTVEERDVTTLAAGIALAVAALAGLASLRWFARLP